MHTDTLALLSISLLSLFLLTHSRSKRPFPRVGPAGPLGYVWSVIRSVFDADGLVKEGTVRFGGKPFVLPTMSGELVIIGEDNVPLLRKSEDSIVRITPFNLESYLMKAILQFNGPERAKQVCQTFSTGTTRSHIHKPSPALFSEYHLRRYYHESIPSRDHSTIRSHQSAYGLSPGNLGRSAASHIRSFSTKIN
jgi:hypothetical protein